MKRAKLFKLCCLLLLAAGLSSSMASAMTVTASPTTCANVVGIGTRNWSNPARAVSSNNSYATASVDGTTTRYLRCTGYNFAIPSGATINGITVNVERRSNSTANGGSRDAAMRIVKAGVIGAADRSTATTYTTTDVTQAHGSATDLWGATWTPADINAANFGAAFAATKPNAAGPAQTVSVDYISITVDYTPAAGTYSVTASPTACASVAGIGNVAWSNPARAVSSNNSYAISLVNGIALSTNYLRCTGYNFAIPSGATINGITVNVERKSNRTSNGGSRDAAMRLVKAGVIGTVDRSTATTYTTTDVTQAHGSATDLWGTAWTPADINAANFGAAFAATKPSSAGLLQIISVDYMSITVTYTISAAAPDHYELSLQTNSITCLPSTVTVTACTDTSSPCTSPYAAASGTSATLSASAGTLAATTVIFGASGVATTTLSYPLATDGAAASVTLSGEQTVATRPRKCCPNGVNCAAANSCSTIFNTVGFIFSAAAGGTAATIPAQVAGMSSGTYYLRAVKTSTTTQACEPALAGTTPVNFAYECNNPASCSGANLMSVNGGTATTIARNNNGSVSSYTPVNMSFDANGNAPFTFNYGDVGLVTLHASKTVNGAPLAGATRNAFVVKPYAFAISGIKCTNTADCAAGNTSSPNNPGASGASGVPFMKAGALFTATITSVTSGGVATPSFGKESVPEGVLLTSSLVAPAGGANPAIINGTIGGSSFTNGVATVSNLAWDEAGIITLSPSVADGNYLGSGNVTVTPSGNIGRFIPHHFVLVSDATVPTPLLTNRSDLTCAASIFTYLGESFSEGFELQAAAQDGAVTTNYATANGFAKLDGAVPANFNFGAVDTTAPTYLTARLASASSSGNWVAGVGGFTAALSLNKAAGTVPDGPFDNFAVGIAPRDTDGVTLASFDLDTDTAIPGNEHARIGTTRLRFGRLRMSNAYGSELLPLAVPLLAQYWNGSGFVLNTDDSCTQVPVPASGSGLTFYAPPATAANTLQAGQTTASINGVTTGNGTFASGDGGLRLSTPNSFGYVDVQITAPSYLQYNWNGTATAGNFFDDNPSARATFGKYRQRNEFIYMREIH